MPMCHHKEMLFQSWALCPRSSCLQVSPLVFWVIGFSTYWVLPLLSKLRKKSFTIALILCGSLPWYVTKNKRVDASKAKQGIFRMKSECFIFELSTQLVIKIDTLMQIPVIIMYDERDDWGRRQSFIFGNQTIKKCSEDFWVSYCLRVEVGQKGFVQLSNQVWRLCPSWSDNNPMGHCQATWSSRYGNLAFQSRFVPHSCHFLCGQCQWTKSSAIMRPADYSKPADSKQYSSFIKLRLKQIIIQAAKLTVKWSR